jgi:hypothetical protein
MPQKSQSQGQSAGETGRRDKVGSIVKIPNSAKQPSPLKSKVFDRIRGIMNSGLCRTPVCGIQKPPAFSITPDSENEY